MVTRDKHSCISIYFKQATKDRGGAAHVLFNAGNLGCNMAASGIAVLKFDNYGFAILSECDTKPERGVQDQDERCHVYRYV